MQAVAVDLADDRFDVTFDPGRVSPADLLRAIRDLDYEPALVEAPSEVAVLAEAVALASLPADLRELLAEARAQDKPVLVEFSGPG